MAFFRQLFTVLLCFVMLSVFLQYVQGLPKPKSWTRTKEEKKMYKRIPIIKASLGATCKLRCSFRSKSSNVQWFLNNKLLSHTNKDYRFKRRHSKELLVISKVTKDHSGIYSCIVAGKKRVACRIIVTLDKKAKCRRKRSTDADDICKKPPKMITLGHDCNSCQHFDFSKCDSFAGDPENVTVFDFILEKKLTIQIQWITPRLGFNDLWGFQGQLIGLHDNANNIKCCLTSKITTYMSFTEDLVYGAEYEAILKSLPSNKMITKRFRTKERCQYDKFKHLRECCTIVNLNGTVLDAEGKIELSWNYKCANNTTVVNKFLVRWTNLQMTHHPAKCLNNSKTSIMNYTIDLPSECRRYNYSIRVYILDKSDKPIDKCTKITVHYPVNPPYPENAGKQESGPNTKIIAAVIGIIAGTALVVMFFIYKYFFTKVLFKLPPTPAEYRYEQQEGNEGALLQRKDCPNKVLIMNARCCEKCNWVVHCLGMLLNATNLVEARSDLWHEQDIASEVMRWYQMEVRDADCVLVLASNTMRKLYEGENIPNRESSDLLAIRAQLNLVSGEMSTEPNTPKFISAYFTYNGQSSDVPTFLNSRLTHQLTKDLDRLIFHILKIEAIQPRRTQPIAVIGGLDFDKKKDELLLAVSEAERYHAHQQAIEA